MPHSFQVIPFDIPHDRELYVVMCSDGVWEYITSEEAMELCVNAPSLGTSPPLHASTSFPPQA